MRLRYISDIHIEFMNSNEVQKLIKQFTATSDEIMILAGDIGNPFHSHYEQFLDHINKTFRKTFLITGNHEYYSHGRTVAETNLQIQTIVAKFPKISFLENSSETFEGAHFIGTTLWSDVRDAIVRINDTKRILGMTQETYQEYHIACRNFLEHALKASTSATTIVITHHMPSYDLIQPQYRSGSMEPYNAWFATNLNDLIETNKHHIKCWIYGHTHTASEQMIQGVPMLCNPVGYPDERETVDYHKQFQV
jgi:predicted MPP superfamily phosphohydrolase